MPDFANPYKGGSKAPPGELEHNLADGFAAWSAAFGVHFTNDEKDSLAKVIGVGFRSFPWLLDIPGVKK